MRTLVVLGVIAGLTLSLPGVALAQGGGPPAGGTGAASGPPGSSSAGDAAKPPTTGAKFEPRSALATPDTFTAWPTPRTRYRLAGEVVKVDQSRGIVTLHTAQGDLDQHFPPRAVNDLQEGDRIEVQLAIRPAGTAGASPQAWTPPSQSGAAPKP
jgi:hypothetical protein